MTDTAHINGLLRATAGRNREAFRTLYAEAASKLFGISIRICRDRSIAEDALQDAFVEIWRKAGSFDPARGNGMAWMSVIARNRAIDMVRKRGRSPVFGEGGTGDGDEGEGRIAAIPDTTLAEDGGTERMALDECLGRLEERQRQLVMEAYLNGLSREELSARYNAPVNTVKTWLRRGLASLKACLEE